jgi:hypothetical protein
VGGGGEYEKKKREEKKKRKEKTQYCNHIAFIACHTPTVTSCNGIDELTCDFLLFCKFVYPLE